MRISDWSSDVCSSDLLGLGAVVGGELARLFGDVGRVADVGRQVAQAACELDALGDRDALRQRGGVVAGDGQRLQPAVVVLRLVLVAQGGGVAVAGVRGGDHGLADVPGLVAAGDLELRSEEHTSELQSLMRISYAVFCLKKKKNQNTYNERRI